MNIQDQTAAIYAQAAEQVLANAREFGIEKAAAVMAGAVLDAMSEKSGVHRDTISLAIANNPHGATAKTFASIAGRIIEAIH